MAKYKKLFIFGGLVAVIAALYLFTPAREYLSPSGLGKLKELILSQGAFAPVVFVLIYAAATIFCLPGSVLTLASGALFGSWLGFLYVIIASNVGANGAFLISRYLGKDFAKKLVGDKMTKLEGGIEKNAFQFMVFVRLIPVFPFNALNYACGLAPIPWKAYLMGSFLGMLPGTFAYVSLGNVVNAVEGGSIWSWDILSRPSVWGPFVLVIALSLLPKLVKKGPPGTSGNGSDTDSSGPGPNNDEQKVG